MSKKIRTNGLHADRIFRNESVILESYLSDLYSVFLKVITSYIVEAEPNNRNEGKMRRMLAEIIKVKNMIAIYEHPQPTH